MKIPRYWAKGTAEGVNASGKRYAFSCWRWSETGEPDARQKARARADEVLQRLLAGERLNSYAYGDRPLREEIVEEIAGGRDGLGLVTRNAYGALVLNAAGAMFMDVDFPPGTGAGLLAGLWGRLSGKKSLGPEERRMEDVRRFSDRHPDLGLRVWRTFAGLRCLVTSQTFNPAGGDAEELMRELDCDPLYVKLCKRQESFRARLTPKPWRLDLARPPARWPFESPSQEKAFRNWLQQYERASSNRAVCRTVAHLGNQQVHSKIEPVLALHDRLCRPDAGLSLA